MGTNGMDLILSNNEHGYAIAMEAAREALKDSNFDWEDTGNNGEPSSYYRAIGNGIRDALREEFAETLDKYDLLGLILSDAINNSDWHEIGESFYESAAESED